MAGPCRREQQTVSVPDQYLRILVERQVLIDAYRQLCIHYQNGQRLWA